MILGVTAWSRVDDALTPIDGETYEQFEKRKELIAKGLESGTYEQVWDHKAKRWKFREVD